MCEVDIREGTKITIISPRLTPTLSAFQTVTVLAVHLEGPVTIEDAGRQKLVMGWTEIQKAHQDWLTYTDLEAGKQRYREQTPLSPLWRETVQTGWHIEREKGLVEELQKALYQSMKRPKNFRPIQTVSWGDKP